MYQKTVYRDNNALRGCPDNPSIGRQRRFQNGIVDDVTPIGVVVTPIGVVVTLVYHY